MKQFVAASSISVLITGCATGSDSSSMSAGSTESRAKWVCKSAVATQLEIADPDSISVLDTEPVDGAIKVRVSAPKAQAPRACRIAPDGSVLEGYYTAEG